MSFNVLRGMPVGQRALRSKIEQRSGEHIYFPDGRMYGGVDTWERTPKPQIFEGWATRFFLYLPNTSPNHITNDPAKKMEFTKLDQSEMKLYYQAGVAKSWYVAVRNTYGYFDNPVSDKDHTTKTIDPKERIPQDSYFSMALRVKGTRYIEALYDEKVIFTSDQSKVPNYDWKFLFKTGDQTLLSWHTTDETWDNYAKWGNYLSMEDMWWPIGTLATITFLVNSVPTDVYIRMHNNKNPDIYFSRDNLKSGSLAHFSITLSDLETFVTTDFDKDKVGSIPSGADGPHYIKPQINKEFSLLRIEMVVPFYEG